MTRHSCSMNALEPTEHLHNTKRCPSCGSLWHFDVNYKGQPQRIDLTPRQRAEYAP